MKKNNIEELENIIELENRIKKITVILKEMTGNEPDYGDIWDERVELVRELNELTKGGE